MPWQLAVPCNKQRWTEMEGGARVRHCSGCGEHVYSIAAHTDAELHSLGSFCGYFPGETLAPPQSRRAMMVGALLTTIAPLMAQDYRIRVQVRDVTHAMVPDAVVTLGDRQQITDRTGIAVFAGLAAGRFDVTVESAGFKRWRGSYSTGLAKEMIIPAELQVGSVGAVLFVELKNQLIVDVLDLRGRAVANATVVADYGAAGKVHGTTDEKGNSSLPLLSEAEGKVTITASGFQPWETVRQLPATGTVRMVAKLTLPMHREQVEVRPSAGRRFWNWMTACTRR